jgi:hypothetical protein
MPTPDVSCMAVCSLEKRICIPAATGTVSPPTFCLRLATYVTSKRRLLSAPPPQQKNKREAGKNAETVFMRWSPICHYIVEWVATNEVSIYIVTVNFSKIVPLNGLPYQNIFKCGSGSY